MEQGAPFCLAQAHRLEPLIELHPPGSGGTAEKWPKGLGIEFSHAMRKIVSRLTISPLTKAFAGACQPRISAGRERKKEPPPARDNRRCARPAVPGSATTARSSVLPLNSHPAPGRISYRPAVARSC